MLTNSQQANVDFKLRIAGVITDSVVDGPGLRYVIFTQGCPHRCIGCHNPHTHDECGGYEISINKLFSYINESKLISGITFSGGEPFLQPRACMELSRLIKQAERKLNIVVYSGYYYNHLLTIAAKNSDIAGFLKFIDILIDGPYEQSKKNPRLNFRGSSNQNIIHLQ